MDAGRGRFEGIDEAGQRDREGGTAATGPEPGAVVSYGQLSATLRFNGNAISSWVRAMNSHSRSPRVDGRVPVFAPAATPLQPGAACKQMALCVSMGSYGELEGK